MERKENKIWKGIKERRGVHQTTRIFGGIIMQLFFLLKLYMCVKCVKPTHSHSMA